MSSLMGGGCTRATARAPALVLCRGRPSRADWASLAEQRAYVGRIAQRNPGPSSPQHDIDPQHDEIHLCRRDLSHPLTQHILVQRDDLRNVRYGILR